MQINVIYVGNIKDSYLAEAVSEYTKRLGAFCKVNEVELKEEKIKDGASQSEINEAMRREGERILAVLPQKSFKIAMCIEGKQISSEEFADVIERTKNQFSQISFVIGGSFGLSDSVKASCDMKVSMSKMTFTHRMARVLLMEQIYRAFSIISGGKYHK